MAGGGQPCGGGSVVVSVSLGCLCSGGTWYPNRCRAVGASAPPTQPALSAHSRPPSRHLVGAALSFCRITELNKYNSVHLMGGTGKGWEERRSVTDMCPSTALDMSGAVVHFADAQGIRRAGTDSGDNPVSTLWRTFGYVRDMWGKLIWINILKADCLTCVKPSCGLGFQIVSLYCTGLQFSCILKQSKDHLLRNKVA